MRVCEDGEDVLMFARIEDESIHGILVVVQDDEELVLVRARGKLDRLLERVMELAAEEDDMPWARHRPDTDDTDAEASALDPPPAADPLIAVCGDEGSAEGCAEAELARDRVLEVARALSLDHEVLR